MEQGKNVVLIGCQYGGEGKGRLSSEMAQTNFFSGFARFNGGHDTEESFEVAGKRGVSKLIPHHVLGNGKKAFIGRGVAVSLRVLVKEMMFLENCGLDLHSRLFVSSACPMILPSHMALDAARLAMERLDFKPSELGMRSAFEDVALGRAIRLGDLFFDGDFSEKLESLVEKHNFILTDYYGVHASNLEEIEEEAFMLMEKARKCITDVSAAISLGNSSGESYLLEGRGGFLEDVGGASAAAGLGIAMRSISQRIGVAKAYSTRVVGKAFPTEIYGEAARRILGLGREKASSRIGWLDAVELRKSVMESGVERLFVTKLDALDGLGKFKICSGYDFRGEPMSSYPESKAEFAHCRPIYEDAFGWSGSVYGKKKEDLPYEARAYLDRISELCEVEVEYSPFGRACDENEMRAAI